MVGYRPKCSRHLPLRLYNYRVRSKCPECRAISLKSNFSFASPSNFLTACSAKSLLRLSCIRASVFNCSSSVGQMFSSRHPIQSSHLVHRGTNTLLSSSYFWMSYKMSDAGLRFLCQITVQVCVCVFVVQRNSTRTIQCLYHSWFWLPCWSLRGKNA